MLCSLFDFLPSFRAMLRLLLDDLLAFVGESEILPGDFKPAFIPGACGLGRLLKKPQRLEPVNRCGHFVGVWAIEMRAVTELIQIAAKNAEKVNGLLQL